MTITREEMTELASILENAFARAAPWVEASCGAVPLQSKATIGVEGTAVHQAVTEVDVKLQDLIVEPVFARFPNWIPLVEEFSPLARRYQRNRGPVAFILDPIDGTLTFSQGRQDYSSLFAVSDNGRLVFGGVACYHPFRFTCTRTPEYERPNPGKPTASRALRILCHYRFLKPPFEPLARKMSRAGCHLQPVPAITGTDLPMGEDGSGIGLGSSGTAILELLAGHWDAYVAPNMTLHDLAGPWCVAADQGAAVIQFRTADPNRPLDWTPIAEPNFYVPSADVYPVRYRILIARTQAIADQILSVFQGEHTC